VLWIKWVSYSWKLNRISAKIVSELNQSTNAPSIYLAVMQRYYSTSKELTVAYCHSRAAAACLHQSAGWQLPEARRSPTTTITTTTKYTRHTDTAVRTCRNSTISLMFCTWAGSLSKRPKTEKVIYKNVPSPILALSMSASCRFGLLIFQPFRWHAIMILGQSWPYHRPKKSLHSRQSTASRVLLFNVSRKTSSHVMSIYSRNIRQIWWKAVTTSVRPAVTSPTALRLVPNYRSRWLVAMV